MPGKQGSLPTDTSKNSPKAVAAPMMSDSSPAGNSALRVGNTSAKPTMAKHGSSHGPK